VSGATRILIWSLGVLVAGSLSFIELLATSAFNWWLVALFVTVAVWYVTTLILIVGGAFDDL